MKKIQKTKKYNLQIPLDVGLVQDAERKAKEIGFDSLQAFTRFMYTNLTADRLNIGILTEDVERLTPEQEDYYIKILEEHEQERKKGRVKTFTDVDDMVKDLLTDD